MSFLPDEQVLAPVAAVLLLSRAILQEVDDIASVLERLEKAEWLPQGHFEEFEMSNLKLDSLIDSNDLVSRSQDHNSQDFMRLKSSFQEFSSKMPRAKDSSTENTTSSDCSVRKSSNDFGSKCVELLLNIQNEDRIGQELLKLLTEYQKMLDQVRQSLSIRRSRSAADLEFERKLSEKQYKALVVDPIIEKLQENLKIVCTNATTIGNSITFE